MLVSTFELLLKPQFPTPPNTTPPIPGNPNIANISRAVLQGYFLTIANVNFIDVTVSLVFTVTFPITNPPSFPANFSDFLDALDITGTNLVGTSTQLIPEVLNNKARLTFTIPKNDTSLLVVLPNIVKRPELLVKPNFEVRGYVEVFLSSLSGSDTATLLVTPQLRGTFFRDATATDLTKAGLDQIAYDLPVSNGGVFTLSNS
jgi:hypothetical protein